MKQIKVNGLVVNIEKKQIKNMYLKVFPPNGELFITAPKRMSEARILEFILSKVDWIEKQQTKIKKQYSAQKTLEYVKGEKIPLWGKMYSLDLIPFTSPIRMSDLRIEIDKERILLPVTEDSDREQRKKSMDLWYRKQMETMVPDMLKEWENRIGVESSSWVIRDMKTRWGTCNVVSRKICLNLQLAKRPRECLEYVIVHELVHLLESSHNQVFKDYMTQFLPDWKERKAFLNRVVY